MNMEDVVSVKHDPPSVNKNWNPQMVYAKPTYLPRELELVNTLL